MFWLLALPLLALGAIFVAAPFFRSTAAHGAVRPALVRALYRQRLAELDEEARLGLLEAGEREDMEAELGQAFLHEVREAGPHRVERRIAPTEQGQGDEGEDAGAVSRQGGKSSQTSTEERRIGEALSARQPALAVGNRLRLGGWVGLIVGLAVPLAAVGLYLNLGEPVAALLAEAPKAMGLDPGKDRIELDRWRTLLGERVRARPAEAGSWFLLGHIYMTDQDYAAAAGAFERAHGLVGEDAGIDLYWLQARYLAGGGRLDAAGAALAERILARTPNQPTALEILALDAYSREDFPAAAALFNRALANPLDPLRRTVLQTAFERARGQLGGTPAIEVAVSTAQPPPAAATLFVVARPVGGGMPYAVVRRPAAVLPQTIRLDNAVSMNPARPLSMAEAVQVVVRISLAGTATAHPGDWQWRSPVLTLDETSAPTALAAELMPPE